MPPAGFELAFPASGRPQTYAIDRAAIGTGNFADFLYLPRPSTATNCYARHTQAYVESPQYVEKTVSSVS